MQYQMEKSFSINNRLFALDFCEMILYLTEILSDNDSSYLYTNGVLLNFMFDQTYRKILQVIWSLPLNANCHQFFLQF